MKRFPLQIPSLLIAGFLASTIHVTHAGSETWNGRKIFDSFHADISLIYTSANGLTMQFDRGEFNDPGLLFPFQDVLIKVRPAIIDKVFDDQDPLRFIGPPETTFVIIPASAAGAGLTGADIIELGFNAFGVSSGVFQGASGGQIHFRLIDHKGPGHFFGFRFVLSTGDTTVFFNSTDFSGAEPNAYPEQADGHSHINMAFTQRGLHTLMMRGEGVLADGTPTTSPLYPIPFIVAPEAFHWWLADRLNLADAVEWQDRFTEPFGAAGIPLLISYAFGLNPANPNVDHLPKHKIINHGGVSRFAIEARFPLGTDGRDDRTDLAYTIVFSEDLEEWTPVPGSAKIWEQLDPDTDGTPRYRITFTDRSPGSDAKGFYRFQLSLNHTDFVFVD